MAIVVDGNDNVYVAGHANTGSSNDIVLTKFDSSGNLLWSKTYDNGGAEQAAGVTCDKNSNVYVTGIEFVTWPDASALTLKYDTNGNLLWSQSYKATSTDLGKSITADDTGNVFVTGITSDVALGSEFLFLKYDATGNLLWSKPYPFSSAIGNSIKTDSAGDVYLAGTHNGTCSVLKFTPAGDLIWSKDTDACNSLAVGSDLSVNLVGDGYNSLNASTYLVTSKFHQLQGRTLNYSKLGTGIGTIAFTPGVTCDGNCSDTYAVGSKVAISEIPDTSSTFTGWGGACSGTGACVITMDTDKAVTATFTVKPQYPFSVKLVGSGYITPDAGYYSCDQRSCSGSFYAGTTVTLTANPYYGYKFSGWSGACSGTGTCTVTMSAAKFATATFTLFPTKKVNVTLSGSGKGAISSDPADKFTCGSTNCSGSYPIGTIVTLTEMPDAYSNFAGWSGACTGSNSNCTLTVIKDLTVGAKFIPKVFNLDVTIAGAKGTVSASPLPNGLSSAKCSAGTCSYPYNALTSVKMTAAPASGYKLVGWSGACSGSSLSCTVTMDDAKSATATFGRK